MVIQQKLHSAGVSLSLKNGQIYWKSNRPLPDELRAEIKANLKALIEALKQKQNNQGQVPTNQAIEKQDSPVLEVSQTDTVSPQPQPIGQAGQTGVKEADDGKVSQNRSGTILSSRQVYDPAKPHPPTPLSRHKGTANTYEIPDLISHEQESRVEITQEDLQLMRVCPVLFAFSKSKPQNRKKNE